MSDVEHGFATRGPQALVCQRHHFRLRVSRAAADEFQPHLPEGFPIDWIDERLTTVQAEGVLLEANVSRKKRKKFVDKIAAVFMLQAYMDAH